MADQPIDVVVAGHICLDMIPHFAASQRTAAELFAPGKLVRIGPASVSLGGAVANTGLALHRLGTGVELIGKVGDDLLGEVIRGILDRTSPRLGERLLVGAGASSSYTVVVSPPGVDRCFWHCPGANDEFSPGEIEVARVPGARWLHFGYPPIMQRTYEDGGKALAELFRRARRQGLRTSLDMAMPDESSAAADVNWGDWLATVLPHVDLFMPSFDEMLLILDRDLHRKLTREASGHNLAVVGGVAEISRLGRRLQEMGCGVAALKLGDQGLYVKTGASTELFGGPGECELLVPCYDANVVGTTGSGDATIAGMIVGALRGLSLEEATLSSVAVGACSVERPDATSGVPTWDEVQRRRAGWRRKSLGIALDGWREVASSVHYRAAADGNRLK